MSSSLSVNSYAKINWTLDVLFRREDGYHEIRTIYQTVSLHDKIRVTETEESAVDVRCGNEAVPTDQTNLAHRAAVKLREATGTGKGAIIEIDKAIPVAGGLGGGSSNAGATLLALNRLWNVNAEMDLLLSIAAGLGSDVPFFLRGGTALGVGRGEEVYSIPDAPPADLLLVNPGFAVPTAGVYAGLKRLTIRDSARIMPFTLLAANGIRELAIGARNDLEKVVLATHPEIEEIKLRLIGLGARHALMSGSGATVFGVFDNSLATVEAARELRTAGLWCESVHTIGKEEYRSHLFDL